MPCRIKDCTGSPSPGSCFVCNTLAHSECSQQLLQRYPTYSNEVASIHATALFCSYSCVIQLLLYHERIHFNIAGGNEINAGGNESATEVPLDGVCKRHRYSIQRKNQVLECLDANSGNLLQTAIQTNIPRQNIQRWMQQRESLEQATHGGCSKYKLPGSGRKLVEVWRDPMLQYIKMLRREDTTRW